MQGPSLSGVARRADCAEEGNPRRLALPAVDLVERPLGRLEVGHRGVDRVPDEVEGGHRGPSATVAVRLHSVAERRSALAANASASKARWSRAPSTVVPAGAPPPQVGIADSRVKRRLVAHQGLLEGAPEQGDRPGGVGGVVEGRAAGGIAASGEVVRRLVVVQAREEAAPAAPQGSERDDGIGRRRGLALVGVVHVAPHLVGQGAGSGS